ncbi:hypothetical protein ASPZODRAFT_150471 [Penicilliopsis zonata CBS 506.65]|uniref:Uncharacterized protein n=1 Tax=Penicilliopsis zonata CBS 506.65 TaxID=1073090 RepID=A0A1L9SM69_9EURO|nr:hypothetical protein ASPZODRAFT_150471 [Penicilliopsis zonata CBS 506.65]OJJ48191.1 hypothetical protein ASPZODRAFT_150471 [Penicilliopsis zonata CBS 506.65]
MVVANASPDEMEPLLAAYAESEGLPAATRLYRSAEGHETVTISGPPVHLERFRARHAHLRTASIAVRGLFHASHLYTADEAKALAEGVICARPVRLHVLSNVDGQVIGEVNVAADLLRIAIAEILTQPMQWNRMTEQAIDSLSSSAETAVLPFAAGSAVTPFAKHGLRLVDTTVAARTTETGASRAKKIAIVGFSGRYPDADSNEEFWELLRAGRDVHREIPRERFDAWLYYDATGKRKNTSRVRHGCFLKNPALFDARFFGLSPREAEQADPAQRLALMTAYEAMEMAGMVPDASPSTQRDRVGVFYGTASDDYRECNSGQDIDTYFVPGGSRAFLPARINYHWRFSGPSLDVDTACSSSLAALHMACNCLWRGDCDTALAGGTNVLTNPDNWAGLDRAHFLSPTGNCRTFDDSADGYCRAESVSTLVLKRLDDALRDGDPVFGTILGAYTNHSAEAVSMTRPHSGAQRAIFARVLAGAGIDRHEISYVEMHGTGTQAGDACEMDAVLNVFAPAVAAAAGEKAVAVAARPAPLYLGSAKANIGHAESASGAASLIKVLLMMQHGRIPPHVGITTCMNRNFPSDLAQRNVHIAFKETEWSRPPPSEAPHGRRAFVNNFGAAGGNSSVLVEDAPVQMDEKPTDPRPVHLVAVSARTKTALQGNIRALQKHLDQAGDLSISSLSFTTTARRMHHSFRVMVTGSSIRDIRDALYAETSPATGVSSSNTPIGFCFTGQGAQYVGMGRQLLEMPPLRALLVHLEGLVRLHEFPSVLSVLDGSIPFDELSPVQAQLTQTCLQMALAKYWQSLGIIPQLVIGHSLGEYAAMNTAGMLSDADTIYLVGTRAMLLQKHCTAGTHAMLAMKVSPRVAGEILGMEAGVEVEIACINGPQDTVVAGPTTAIDSLVQRLSRQSIKATRVSVPFAFHSAQVEAMLDGFRQRCRAITFSEPKIPLLSSLLGRAVRSLSDLKDDPAGYFTRHCREPVAFSSALQGVEARTVWLEVGPHPICANMLRTSIGAGVQVLPSLRRSEGDWATIVSTLAALYTAGVAVNWGEYHCGFGKGWRVLPLPAYQWDLKEYWIPYRHDWCLTKGDPPVAMKEEEPEEPEEPEEAEEPLTASVQKIIQETHNPNESSITARSNVKYPRLMAVLRGHRINGRPMCPSSVYADMALTLFTRLLDGSSLSDGSLGVSVADMVVDKALLLDETEPMPAQWIELNATANWTSRTAQFTLHSVSPDGQRKEQHARCTGSFTPTSAWKAEWQRRRFLVTARIDQLQRGLHDDDTDAGAVQLLRPALFYRLFSSLVQYDEAFCGLRELLMHSAGLECTARIRFNTPPDEAEHWGGCPPYWIESLGQITGFTLNGNETLDTETQVFINHGWGCMRLLTPLAPDTTYRTYVKMQQHESAYSGDLYIFNGDGDIVGMYEGVVFNVLRRSVFDRLIQTLSTGSNPGPNPRVTSTNNPRVTAVQPNPRVMDFGSNPRVNNPRVSMTPTIPPMSIPPVSPVKPQDSIRRLVAEEVGVSLTDLTDDDDLVDLGVDSLLALTMADRILEEFNVKIPSTAFMNSLTVREVIHFIVGDSQTDSPEMESPEMDSLDTPSSQSSVVDVNDKLPLPPASSVLLQGNPQASKTLWLAPDGSGLATAYLTLPDIDIHPSSVAVYGLNSPFVKRDDLAMSRRSFAELIDAYLVELRRRQPHGPYFLGGWSAGGICAYEMAQRLVADGETVSRLILMDSPNPIRLAKLPLRLYEEFTRLGVFGADTASSSNKNRPLPSWLLSHFQGFVDLLHTYTPKPFMGFSPLQTWVIWAQEGVDDDESIVIRPEDPPNVHWLLRRRAETALRENGWDVLVGRENMHIQVLQQANHFTMLKAPAVSQMSMFLARAMDD